MLDRILKTICSRGIRLKRDEDGSILIFSLFLFVIMLMVSGLAVDFMRAETKRIQLQSTLDRAVLAAASMKQSLDSETVVRDYFERAGLDEYLQDVTVTETEINKTVRAVAAAAVQPYFLNMLGFEQLPAKAGGTAREGLSNIEISLILDVSGSMGWTSSTSGNRKIEDLKNAAQEFVYRVQCNPDTANLFNDPCTIDVNAVSINLVMYNEQVLVGESLLQRFNVTNEHTYSSCVDFEDASYFDTNIEITDPLQRAGHIDARTMWQRDSSPDSHLAREYRRACRPDPHNEIIPLEEDWVTLFDRIENLTPGGYTSIEMGMKWGAALLDPAFRPVTGLEVIKYSATGGAEGIIPEFLPRPHNFTFGGVEKFIVLMTDGENTSHTELKDEYYSGLSEVFLDNDTGMISVYRQSQNNYVNPITGGTQSDPWGTDPRQLDFVELWERFGTDFYDNSQNNSGAHTHLPNPVYQSTPANKNSNLVHVCQAVNDKAVTIYTVGFETTTSSTAVLKKCASSHAHHFDVDGNSIDDAFAAIARDIQKLRLVN